MDRLLRAALCEALRDEAPAPRVRAAVLRSAMERRQSTGARAVPGERRLAVGSPDDWFGGDILNGTAGMTRLVLQPVPWLKVCCVA
ncbi:MAG TPA: hypothetical protein VIK33_13550 [Anaerolineae bacterium]